MEPLSDDRPRHTVALVDRGGGSSPGSSVTFSDCRSDFRGCGSVNKSSTLTASARAKRSPTARVWDVAAILDGVDRLAAYAHHRGQCRCGKTSLLANGGEVVCDLLRGSFLQKCLSRIRYTIVLTRHAEIPLQIDCTGCSHLVFVFGPSVGRAIRDGNGPDWGKYSVG